MELVIGTYEEFLVGYTLKKKKGQLVLEQSFTNHAHCGSVRSIATSGKYLASGSIDEAVHIINMKHRVDSGTLISHTGTITALEFVRSAYLFSASEDGNISIWNTKRQWQCEKILRGHKEAVNSLSVHSSGKLLLSVSKDKSLRTWNLIKGRCAYILNLKDIAHQVLWSTSCIYFAVVFDHRIDVYDLSTGGILNSIEKSVFGKRINKVLFIDDNTIIICGDCNEVLIYNLNAKFVVNKFTAHENRIKDMAWANFKNLDTSLIDQETIRDNNKWLVTTSSDGFIKIWSLDISNLESEPSLVAKVNSTCRPTCLAVWTTNQNPNEKIDNFSIPDLKISKEELQVCMEKIKEKRNKRKFAEEGNKEKLPEQNDAQLETNNDSKVTSPKRNIKKAKITKQNFPRESITIEKQASDKEDDDDDDDEAIRNMKASSTVLKEMTKYKKGNKRNISTFKQRRRQLKLKKNNSNGFKVDKFDSKSNSNNKRQFQRTKPFRKSKM